jgi:hypothetical protein
MNHERKTLSWWEFVPRVFVIGVVTTWFLINTTKAHDYVSTIVVVCAGYIALPLIIYWRARRKNRSSPLIK